MNSEPRDEAQRSLCPQCGEMHGKTCCVVVGHGVRTIHYICTTCFHEWQHAVLLPDSPFAFLRPDEDP